MCFKKNKQTNKTADRGLKMKVKPFCLKILSKTREQQSYKTADLQSRVQFILQRGRM